MAEMTEEQRKKFSKIGKSNVSTAKAHERRVKKLLSEWSGKEFRRRRVEGRGDDVSVVEGVADVIPVEGEIIFAIEAKKEKGFSFDSLLGNTAGNQKFTKWWHQTCYDAHLLTTKTGKDKFPLLFFKPNPSWDWIAVDQKPFLDGTIKPKPGITLPDNWDQSKDIWFPHLAFNAFSFCGEVTKNIAHSSKNKVMHSMNLSPCYICRWKDFGAYVDADSIFVQN